jgi:hypothetical protein
MLRIEVIIKKAQIVLSIILLGGLLTSCGASAEEKALKANCDKIFANLQKIGDREEIFRNSDVADGQTVAILLGEDTRQNVEKKIIAKYPFLDEIETLSYSFDAIVRVELYPREATERLLMTIASCTLLFLFNF